MVILCFEAVTVELGMGGLREVAQIAIGQVVPMAGAFVFLIAAEMVFRMPGAKTGNRVRALVFWIFYVAASAITLAVWYRVLKAFNLHPLLDVDLTPSGLWKWPLLIPAVLVGAIFSDLPYYWCHRAQHTIFWRFHAVHHSIRDLSAVNSYHHWTEELCRLPIMTAPIALLVNVHAEGGAVVAILLLAQTWWVHAPLRLRIGPFRRLINEPQMHRIHHSTNPQHFDKNFGGLTTIWDQAFGTAYFPEPHEWPDTGLDDQPEAATIGDYITRPFAKKV